MNKILVIAPHPDDETLGCGGTLLRNIAEGNEVHWLIVTSISTDYGFTDERVVLRNKEINSVKEAYGFHSVAQLKLPTMRLDQIPTVEMVDAISKVVLNIQPDTLFIRVFRMYFNDACFAAVFEGWGEFLGIAQVE